MAAIERPEIGGEGASAAVDKYYTASQWQLVWWRFRRHRSALIGGWVLLILTLLGTFSGFFGPYGGTTRDRDYVLGGPQLIRFWDHNGFSFRPFVHGFKTERDPVTLQKIATVDPESRRYLQFFVQGDKHRVLGLFETRLRLFGVDKGKIHIFGTDDLGRDLFSRTMIATGTSISIGVVGVLLSFVLALIIGGIAGYFGGWIDYVIQRATEIVRVVPAATNQLPSASLGRPGGGSLAVDPTDPEGLSTLEKVFEIDIALPAERAASEIGGRVHVRFRHGAEPLVAEDRSLR